MKTLAITLLMIAAQVTAFAHTSESKSNKECCQAKQTKQINKTETSNTETIEIMTSAKPATDKVTALIVNQKGEELQKEEVSMYEFLSGSFAKTRLPKNTSFLMFHENTAYYVAL